MAVNFLKNLKKFYPKIYDIAVEINKKDNFLMWIILPKRSYLRSFDKFFSFKNSSKDPR